jgi:hypothetical protein
MQDPVALPLAQDPKRLPLQRMLLTDDARTLWQVPDVGSVS